MSLFENELYEYCDTFFAYLNADNRPSAEVIRNAFNELGPRYTVENVVDIDGKFQAATIKSPGDFSAMDITYVQGEEVTSQLANIYEEIREMTLLGDAQNKMQKMMTCTGRFDLFHFEEKNANDDVEFLDPGGLIIVLQKIASTCDGVCYDPQSQDIF